MEGDEESPLDLRVLLVVGCEAAEGCYSLCKVVSTDSKITSYVLLTYAEQMMNPCDPTILPRWPGGLISEMYRGIAQFMNPTPSPLIPLPARNIPMLTDPACMAAETMQTTVMTWIAFLRPRISRSQKTVQQPMTPAPA